VNTLYHWTVRVLKKYGIKPVKRLSQNFLIDESIRNRILDVLALKGQETVLEVGPGIGNVTHPLLRYAGRVIAVEVDRRLAKVLLSETPKDELAKLDLIIADILKVPPFKVDKVISNVPYHISSKLTFKLLKEYEFNYAILAYQKEYAFRLRAKPGTEDYGRLTVMVSLYGRVEPLFTIPRRAFYPPPRVDSMVVKLVKEPKLGNADPQVLEWLVRSLFNQRRKKVVKVLRFSLSKLGASELANELAEAFKLRGRRVYELPPSLFLEMAKYLSEKGFRIGN